MGLLILCAVFTGTSCMQEQQEEEKGINIQKDADGDINIKIEGSGDLAKALKEAKDALGEAKESIGNVKITDENGEEVEPVDFRELKAMLPRSAAGLSRTDASGQKSGMFGLKVSTAEGLYKDGNKRIKVNIADGGGIGGLVKGMADWSTIEIDSESDNGYEKTTTIDGHKAFVKWEDNRQKGQIAVIVNDRFVVSIEGKNVTMDDLEEVLDDIDLDELG